MKVKKKKMDIRLRCCGGVDNVAKNNQPEMAITESIVPVEMALNDLQLKLK